MGEWNPDDLSTYSDFGHPGVAQDAIDVIQAGADPNIKDDELEATPLIKTSIDISEHSLRVAEALLKAGADINLTNKFGVTALHQLISHHRPGHFCYDDQLKRAQFLIDHGVEINTRADGFCTTPLHMAVYMEAQDMVALLLKHGADPNTQDSEGRTPKELAVQEGFNEIAAMF